MSRKPLGERAMTDAERQARYRAACAGGQPVIRFRRPADHRGRAKRWCATVDELVQLQAEYQAWLDALSEALRAICDLDLEELQTVEPPRGFGRD